MFIGREKELVQLHEAFTQGRKCIALVYGKRRIGKSTLIRQAAKGFNGTVIDHMCIKSSFEGNLSALSSSISTVLNMPGLSFTSINDCFTFLGKQHGDFLLILDEYQFLKNSKKNGEVDSLMQVAVEHLPENLKLVLCGSYITILKELLEESNPLFGRLTLTIHLKEMDYYDAAKFMGNLNNNSKSGFYSVFGGSPYVLSVLDYTSSLADNIKRFLLGENSLLGIHIESIMLSEIKTTFDIRILEIIGNGKKKYSEILSVLNSRDNGYLDKQLKALVSMETLRKVSPINKRNDKKKTFYEIEDNLMRFYFSYIFGKQGYASLIGTDNYFNNYINSSLNHFISYRYEDIVFQYLIRQVKSGRIKGAVDIGSLWYDDPANKKNGQFDCVIKFNNESYKIYEVKFYSSPMSITECQKEIAQIADIPGLKEVKTGFVCSSGFDFSTEDYDLIDGDMIYT